jgi:hypothetical protein
VSDGTWAATRVQSIKIGFTDTDVWYSNPNDSRLYGNFVPDNENGYLYAYLGRDAANNTRVFKFAMPELTETEVVLTQADILDQFDVPYEKRIQGGYFCNGRIYSIDSYAGHSSFLCVIDVNAKKEVTRIDLAKINLCNLGTQEGESVDAWNNQLLIGVNSNIAETRGIFLTKL